MSTQDNGVCEVCGGVKSLGGFVQAERDGSGVKFLTYDGKPACIGHLDPVPKHDGRMVIRYGERDFIVRIRQVDMVLTPTEALSLLMELERERETLERLAKEQEQ